MERKKEFKTWKLEHPLPVSAYFNERVEAELEGILLRDGIYESKLVSGVVYISIPETKKVLTRIEKGWSDWQSIPVYLYNLKTKTIQQVRDARTCSLSIEEDKKLIKKVLGVA